MWQAFALWLVVATLGCNDYDDEDRNAHAEELQVLAEEFIRVFVAVAGPGKGTVYMHEILCHVKATVAEFGSLAKFSCQGFEAMHQVLKDYAHRHSNRSVANTCYSVLINVQLDPNVVLNNSKG